MGEELRVPNRTPDAGTTRVDHGITVFCTSTRWIGYGADGDGDILAGGQDSCQRSQMSRQGVGANPESAVTECFAATLFGC